MIDTRVMPEDVAKDVGYTNHGQQGDGFRYELTLVHFDETRVPPEEVTRRFSWTISQSQNAEHRGHEKQLEDDTRARYIENFLGRLGAELHQTKSTLVRAEGRLVRRRT